MVKVKKTYFSISTEEFENDVWPELEKELREFAEDEMSPPGVAPGAGGGPAGGLSAGFDSLSAVKVVVAILPDHMKEKSPPPEFIIQEGGYADVEEFLSVTKTRISQLCIETTKKASDEKAKEVA